jgi:hypothetical protein
MKVHHLAYLLVPFILFAPLSAEAQRRASDLVDPAPISIPSDVTQSAAREAVVSALLGRGWVVIDETDDQVIADLNVRSHWAQIGIDIDSDENVILISYRDSDNLRYQERSDGRIVIHSGYLGWVDNLVGDIRSHLARAQRDARR